MPTHDNRRWTTQGDRLIGTATDGRPDQVLIVLPPGLNPNDHAPRPDRLAHLLNGLSRNDIAVLDAATTIQNDTGWPAPAADVADATGLSVVQVHRAYEHLVKTGYGERPPAAGTRPRPFKVHTPALSETTST